MRRSYVLFSLNEICASTGVRRLRASHMSPTLYRCQRLQISSKLAVRHVCFVDLTFLTYVFVAVKVEHRPLVRLLHCVWSVVCDPVLNSREN